MNSNGNSNNIEKIKSYLKRLDAGENLESVRADFKIEFRLSLIHI